MKMLQMVLFIIIFLNVVGCFWIKIFEIVPSDFIGKMGVGDLTEKKYSKAKIKSLI